MKKNLLPIIFTALSFPAFSQSTAVQFTYTGAAQTFTVPPCVTSLTIEVRGAQGGAVTAQSPFPQGGLGAIMVGDFTVTPGDVLTLVVGGRGNPDPSSSGGGGGTGVNLLGNPLIVAGGGAGVDFQDPNYPGQNAVITTNGVDGNNAPGSGGTGGGVGADNAYTSTNISRGGNGWNIGNSGSMGVDGLSTNTTFTAGTWGLGGGGGSVGYGWCNCGGGGGGYSGGGSAQINQSGGGGGSYNVGTNQVNTPGFNTGDGLIIITYSTAGGPPPAPTSISGTSSICIGSGPFTYTISAVSGATSYTWTVPSGSTINSGQGTTSINITPGSTSGNITVTANNACGSSSATTFSLTINPLPTVTANSTAASVCAGSSVTLTGGGASTYTWSGGVTNAVSFIPVSTQTYTVTGTDANGCMNTANTVVTVNTLPTVTANSTAASVCAGSSVTLTGGGASTYTWSGGVTNAVSFIPVSTQTYTVTGTDANGCMNTANTIVTVNPLPTVTANSTSSAVCAGGSVTLTGGGATTYTWSGGVTDAISFVPVSTQTYTVTGTDANDCSNAASTTVTVNPLPTVTASAPNANVCTTDQIQTLTGTPAGGSWTGPGVTGNSFDPSATGVGAQTLTYSYTDINGCSNSANTTITVSICTGVNGQGLLNGISVYPNPSNGTFTISVNSDVHDLKIVISDLQGRVVYSSNENNVNAGYAQQINLQTESTGLYLMQISSNGEVKTQKISIQK